jgi:hypothetical protein
MCAEYTDLARLQELTDTGANKLEGGYAKLPLDGRKSNGGGHFLIFAFLEWDGLRGAVEERLPGVSAAFTMIGRARRARRMMKGG